VIDGEKAFSGFKVRRLQHDPPELLSFFALPRHLRKKVRTTNVIERCFVEAHRHTRPMVCSVNVASVDRIIYSIFQRFNLEWKNAPSTFLHKQLDISGTHGALTYIYHYLKLYIHRLRKCP